MSQAGSYKHYLFRLCADQVAENIIKLKWKPKAALKIDANVAIASYCFPGKTDADATIKLANIFTQSYDDIDDKFMNENFTGYMKRICEYVEDEQHASKLSKLMVQNQFHIRIAHGLSAIHGAEEWLKEEEKDYNRELDCTRRFALHLLIHLAKANPTVVYIDLVKGNLIAPIFFLSYPDKERDQKHFDHTGDFKEATLKYITWTGEVGTDESAKTAEGITNLTVEEDTETLAGILMSILCEEGASICCDEGDAKEKKKRGNDGLSGSNKKPRRGGRAPK